MSPPQGEGPGTGLSRIFSWFVPKPEGCDCPNRAAMMDVWGGPGCLERLPLILSWLRESALDNDYPYNEWIVSSLLKNFLKCYE